MVCVFAHRRLVIRFCCSKDSTTESTETPVLPTVQAGIGSLATDPPTEWPLELFFFFLPVPACRGLLNRTPATEPIETFAVVSRNPACRSHRFVKTRRLRETWACDCFITLRYDPPLWLVTAVTQTAIFFLIVLQFPGASFQCGNTCQDPSG